MLKHYSNSRLSSFCIAGLSVVLTYLFFLVPTAFAQDSNPVLDTLAGAFGALIYPLAHTIGTIVVGIGGYALNGSIQYLIVGWGGIYNGTSFGANITQVWAIIRDLFNILFIFSFIYLGIRTILNSDDSGTRKGIINLIIAALFINFSLFITLAIIDFSNVIATQIYSNLIYTGVSYETGGGQGDISGAFMEAASIGSFFANPSSGVEGTNLIFYSIFMLIFFIVAGIIFLFATYHVIYRFVVLSLCLIFSPVLFLGLILPNFKGYTKKWTSTLLRHSFFAPAFLFLLYVSLQVLMTLKSMFGGTEGIGFTTILDGKEMSPDSFTIFLLFGLAIGFLYAAVKVGDTMGMAGAQTTLGALDRAQRMGRQFVGNATFGAAGGLLRDTVGRRAYNLSESEELKEQARKRGFAGAAARAKLRASRVVGDASFDVRKVGGAGKTIGIGEGNKGGYKTRTEEIEKKEKTFAKSLGDVEDTDTEVMLLNQKKQQLEDTLTQLKRDDKNGNIKSDLLTTLETQKAKLQAETAKLDATNPEHREALAANTVQITEVEAAIKKEEKELKDKLSKEISSTEKAVKEADESIKREKNRRQIGTEVDAAKAGATREMYNATKEELAVLNKQLKEEADDTKKREVIEEIKKVNKRRKELAREAKEAEGSLGYAGVLEKRGFLTSTVLGRVTQQDHDAGEAIRKQYEKSVEKSKEDAANDSLKEAIEKSAKK